MNTIFVNISFFHYCQNIFCGRKKWLCGSIWPTGRSLKTPDIDYEEEWWQHTPLSGVYQHGERLWFNSTDCEQEYSYLTASKRWPSTPFSRNTPQSFSGGTRSCNFPRLTKHVYTSLECSQDFSKICWRVEFCSDVLRPWRTPHRYDPALVQLFRGIFLQSTWRTLFQEGWGQRCLSSWCIHSRLPFCVSGWSVCQPFGALPKRCTVSILNGGRRKADFDTIEINLVGSHLYRIMDSSHESHMLV